MLVELRGGTPPPVSLDDRLERDLGFDSLARVELTLRIEQAFGVRLGEPAVLAARTVRDLLAALASAAPRAAPSAALEAPLAAATAATPEAATTLTEVLEWHAERHPERVHLRLLEQGEPVDTIDYRRLAAAADLAAAGLRARGLEPGQRVAIMLPTGFDFFRAFFGALLAGGVPVPLYPPFRWSQIEEHLARQARILANCSAPVLVADARVQPLARLLQGKVPSLRHVTNAGELASGGAGRREAARSRGDLALVQYTSGSTGQPKGVVLTHANLLANIRAMGEAARAGPADVFVSWLPLYHDMGLIGAWLGSLYYGIPLVLMPPQDFLARPSRWLWAIHRHRATLSAGPNFAYELAARIPDDELRGLDLSAWRLAFNGAEPVRAATLERFARRFAAFGFDPRAATPVYGLAECALGLTFPPLGRGPLVDEGGPAGARRLVSCGRPLRGHEMRIVDELGREAPERAEGRIEFRGPSATSGYLDNPEASAGLVRAGWLDTGDLGYVANGELYITGRVKDLVIRGGHNVHPYDLEEAVGALPGIRKGCVAVFGATDRAAQTERLVVVAETREASEPRRRELRRAVAELAAAQLGAPADDIVLVAPHTVPKTSSGKIRHAACRELYEDGALGARRRPVPLQLARLSAEASFGALERVSRAALGWLFAAYAWMLFGAAAALGALLLFILPRAFGPRLAHGAARALVALSGVPFRVEGAERLAGALPAIVVANHASYADAVVLTAALPPEARFTVKRELEAHPVAGPLLRRIGVRFVERAETKRAIEDARALARAAGAGESPVVFPEGTFTRAPGLAAFHMGAFVAAAETGRPVLPVALHGTRSVLRDGSWVPRRHPVEVFILDPLHPGGRGWEEALRLRDEARRAILQRCGEPDLGTTT